MFIFSICFPWFFPIVFPSDIIYFSHSMAISCDDFPKKRLPTAACEATRWHCPSGYGHGRHVAPRAPGNLAENHPEVVNIYNNLSTSEKYVLLYIYIHIVTYILLHIYIYIDVCVFLSCGMIGMFLDECFLANNGHHWSFIIMILLGDLDNPLWNPSLVLDLFTWSPVRKKRGKRGAWRGMGLYTHMGHGVS